MGYYVCKMPEMNALTAFLRYNRENDLSITTTIEDIRLTAEQEKEMTDNLEGIYTRWKMYYDYTDKSNLYYEFNIPKSGGGLRHITAPKDGPAVMFTDIQMHLENGFLNSTKVVLSADDAYAYVKKRWCKMAVEKHQRNESEYFGHFDFHDFFGSSTKEFVYSQLEWIYPFGPYCEKEENEERLHKVLDICFLNNGLPQGTQVSPMLSNIIMIPFDNMMRNIINSMNNRDSEYKFVYTRYADDIFISSNGRFGIKNWEYLINDTLKQIDAPFRLNESKTTYKRNKGKSNFILGIQLNQDNDMTIGRKRKKEIRWMLHSYFNHKENWSTNDLQSLAGELNYFKCVEPEVFELTMNYYNNKYDCDVVKTIYKAISG